MSKDTGIDKSIVTSSVKELHMANSLNYDSFIFNFKYKVENALLRGLTDNVNPCYIEFKIRLSFCRGVYSN